MSEISSKLCKICLSSNTETGLYANSSLQKFFGLVLGVHEPPLELWLCVWCKSILRKIVKFIQLAEKSEAFLVGFKEDHCALHIDKHHKPSFLSLSIQHNEHNDIPPKSRKSRDKNKGKCSKKSKNDIQFVNLNESSDGEIIIKDESIEDICIDEVKIETMEIDIPEYDDRDDIHDERDDDIKIDKSRKEVNPKLYAKCEENDFDLKILTFEEQMAELEEKKKADKYLSKKYKCEFCGIGFVTKDVYEEHNKRHQESHSPHECPICRLRFTTSLVLSQHLLAHARRFRCRLCGAAVCRVSDCERHRLKCGRAAPGVCPHCSKIFSNLGSLEQHVRGVHYKKEKKFVCSYCNQRFQSKQRLAIHTRTHTGDKPYRCDICDRSFAANSNLRNHLSAHEQARPHYCVECDKSYKTRKGLRRHLLEGAMHLGKSVHSCHHCLKNFTSEKLLASHISATHTKDNSCTMCDKSFESNAMMKKHLKTDQSVTYYKRVSIFQGKTRLPKALAVFSQSRHS